LWEAVNGDLELHVVGEILIQIRQTVRIC
jgi:hypothetical protein